MRHWNTRLVVGIAALATLTVLTDIGMTQETGGSHYSSTVNGHKFLGASRVSIQDLSEEDAPTKTAKMQLDRNSIGLNNFGDPGITTLADYPFNEIKLTKVNVKDPAKNQGRLLYDVEFVDQKDPIKEKIRLVWIPGANDSLSSVRLLLLDGKDNVTQMLELRQGK